MQGVVDRPIAPALLAENIHVGDRDPGRLARHLEGEVAKAADAWLEVGLTVVVHSVFCQLVECALGTEVVCVRANSVVTAVRPRDDDCEELAFGTREL